MNWRVALVPAFALALASPPTWAGDDDDDDPAESTLTGKRPPPMKKKEIDGTPGDVDSPYTSAVTAEQLAAAKAMPYPPVVYRGAQVLGLPEDFVQQARDGLEQIYLRDYKSAKTTFDELGKDYRGGGVGPVGQALVWQAMMLENFDFKYESQYQVSYKNARVQLEQSLTTQGNEGFEYFLLAGILGVDAIHTMRHGDYLTALNRGYEAMKSVAKCKAAAPDFPDVVLGDGIYNYWRTVVTLATPALPDFGDHREEGIQQIMKVEREGIFLSAPATLALTFTWIEEGDNKRALDSALRNKRAYPDNVVNNLVLGRIHTYLRKYDAAILAFQDVLRVAPDNQRVQYYKSQVYTRQKDYAAATKSIDTYLAFTNLSDDQRAEGLHQKGEVYYKQKDWDNAEEYYKQAWKTGKLKRSKARLERVKNARKADAGG